MARKERMLLIAMTVGVSTLLILRDILGIGLSKFIFLGFIVGAMAMAQYKSLVYMICFIMPLVCGLPGTYIMPCALVLLILKKGKIELRQFLLIALITLLELVAAFWYPNLDFTSIVQYISFAGVLIFLVRDDTELDYLLCVRLYLFGTVVLVGLIVVGAIIKAPSNWLRLFARGHFRFGDTQSEDNAGMMLSLNANSMAYYSVVGMTCGILLADKETGIRRVFYIALAALCAISGWLSLSRSYLLVAVGCLMLYIFSKLRTPKQFLTVLFVLVLLFFVGWGYLEENPELLDGFITRMNENDISTGNGRTETFVKYMEVFIRNVRYVFLGAGVTQYQKVIEIRSAMHNGIQQILVCGGLCGFMIYMVVLIEPILQIYNRRKPRFAYWMPIISVAVFTQTIQFLNPMMLMLPYIIGVYSLKADMF